ncbi:hypothetical protein BAE44_0016643, partial [Dichanthelium oligosanthes]
LFTDAYNELKALLQNAGGTYTPRALARGEYLTFVSLLMSHAGLENFAERQQRVQLRLPKE